MKSIVQTSGVKECYFCRALAWEEGYYGELTDKGLHKHHIMHGTANRKLADKFGLWVWLCPMHHEFGSEAVHRAPKIDLLLKQIGQKAFELEYGHDKWMEVFNKNYLEVEDGRTDD